MTDLKPCPFCASLNFIGIINIMDEYAVYCSNCGGRGPNEVSEKLAVKMWNLRRDKFPNEKGFLSETE